MKTVLYVIRSVGHLSYHTSVLKALVQEGCRVVLLHDEVWSSAIEWPKAALSELIDSCDGIEVAHSVRRDGRFRGVLFGVRELRSYSSYLTRKGQDDFYRKRWEGYLHPWVQIFFGGRSPLRFVLAFWPARLCFALFEKCVPASQAVIDDITKYRPDVVVASPVDMRFSEEVEYVKAARKLRIPAVVPVLSWDNLTTKGLFHVHPDVMLVWNRLQFNEAKEIHGVHENKLRVTGSPFLDKWFDTSNLRMNRIEFCRQVGLDPERPFIIYLGSSGNIASDETWLISGLADALRSSSDVRLRAVQILARPHGANQKVFKNLNHDNIKVWLRDGQLPDSREGLKQFVTAINEALCSLGLNTTAMVDAIMANCPVIAMTVPEYSQVNAAKAVHFQYLLNAEIYDRADSPEICTGIVGRLLDGKDEHAEQRELFVNEYVWPRGRDRTAGQVQAEEIIRAASKGARK